MQHNGQQQQQQSPRSESQQSKISKDRSEEGQKEKHEEDKKSDHAHRVVSPLCQRCTIGSDGAVTTHHNGPEKEGVFIDPDAMKEKVRQRLMKPKYDVRDLYYPYGLWPKIARSHFFESITLAVIGCNSCWIMIDTDRNDADILLFSAMEFQIVENFFCCYFSFEWLARFMSFRKKRHGFRDTWFAFDSMLVTMMALETWVMSTAVLMGRGPSASVGDAQILRAAKLFRLSRLCRMARLLRAMPELMIMIKGLLAAARSVFFTLVLLIGLLFIFGIAFVQMAKDYDVGVTYFSSVPSSMYFLLVHGTLLLSTDYKALELRAEGGLMLTSIFFVFILLGAVLIMNVLIGVLCEVVSAVALVEKEEMLVNYVRAKLEKVMAIIDEDGGGTISREEFGLILENIDAMEALIDVGVDVVGLVDFADFIFGDDGMEDSNRPQVELTLSEFLEVILQLRGSNNASVKDMVDLRKFVHNHIMHQSAKIHSTHEQLTEITNNTQHLLQHMEDPERICAAQDAGTGDVNGHADIHNPDANIGDLVIGNLPVIRGCWSLRKPGGVVELLLELPPGSPGTSPELPGDVRAASPSQVFRHSPTRPQDLLHANGHDRPPGGPTAGQPQYLGLDRPPEPPDLDLSQQEPD
eukprot:TRINITY_DN2651_c0_g4_i1.p1 TRINITY_DN2651_c0_g4~~TRINITY_DN2651_c0_g4_i1.p1  ORF type:complete len:636 (+),score=147.39 TRINITY_DN2651_c0_g4_i1:141-2048(+)